MNAKTRTFLTICIGIFPFIFFAPLLFKSAITLAIPFFAVVAYVACLFSRYRLSDTYKGLALFCGWILYISIGALYLAIKGAELPPIETILVVEPAILTGLAIGFTIYIVRPFWLKAAFGILSLAFIVFMFVSGETSYQNKLYYGSFTGAVSEPLAAMPQLTDIDGNPVKFGFSENKYFVIQIYNKGYGYSQQDVIGLMEPLLEKYQNDPRVQLLIIGVPTGNALSNQINGKEIELRGLPYAECAEADKIARLLFSSPSRKDGVVIIKQDTVLFRGDNKMVNRRLEQILGS